MPSPPKVVQWVGSGEPPAQVVAHLKKQGLVLRLDRAPQTLPAARLSLLGTMATPEQVSLAGRRVAVLHPDPGTADALAQSLREKGAHVRVLSLAPRTLDRAETLDPDAVLVESSDFLGACWETVRAVWAHSRLRWAPIMLAPPESLGALDCSPLCGAINVLSTEYDALRARAASGEPFECSVDLLGPARTLRALVASGVALRLKCELPSRTIELDLAEQLVAGARELPYVKGALLGRDALAKVLETEQAKIYVRRNTAPTEKNIMAPLDEGRPAGGTRSSQPHPWSAPPARIVSRDSAIIANNNLAISAPTPGPRLPPPPARLPAPSGTPQVPVRASQGSGVGLAAQAPVADRRRGLASAAALQVDVDWELSVVAPLPEQDSQPAIAEPFPAAAPTSDVWESAELNRLLEAPAAAEAPPDVRPANWAHRTFERIKPPARAGVSRAYDYARKRPLVTTVVLGTLLAVWFFVSTQPGQKPETPGPNSALKITVRKVTPEPAAPVEESSEALEDSQLETSGDAGKAAARRASKLVSDGHALRRDGQLTQAAALYREALKEYPRYPRALAGLSRVAIEQGDGRTAVRFARALVRLRPRQSASHRLLGDAYRVAGNPIAAMSAWKAAARRGDHTAKGLIKESRERDKSASK